MIWGKIGIIKAGLELWFKKECQHKNTQIWEPHLAGARKCLDCDMVYNPNRRYSGKSVWFYEDKDNE